MEIDHSLLEMDGLEESISTLECRDNDGNEEHQSLEAPSVPMTIRTKQRPPTPTKEVFVDVDPFRADSVKRDLLIFGFVRRSHFAVVMVMNGMEMEMAMPLDVLNVMQSLFGHRSLNRLLFRFDSHSLNVLKSERHSNITMASDIMLCHDVEFQVLLRNYDESPLSLNYGVFVRLLLNSRYSHILFSYKLFFKNAASIYQSTQRVDLSLIHSLDLNQHLYRHRTKYPMPFELGCVVRILSLECMDQFQTQCIVKRIKMSRSLLYRCKLSKALLSEIMRSPEGILRDTESFDDNNWTLSLSRSASAISFGLKLLQIPHNQYCNKKVSFAQRSF